MLPFRDAWALSHWLHGTGMVSIFIHVTPDYAYVYNPQYKYPGLKRSTKYTYKKKPQWEWELARECASKWDITEWGKAVGIDGLFSWESLKFAQSEYPDLKIKQRFTTAQFLDIY